MLAVLWWLSTLGMGALRVWLILAVLGMPDLSYVVTFCAIEGASLGAGLVNLRRARPHYSWSGILVPCLYAVGALVLPSPPAGFVFHPTAALLAFLGVVLSACALTYLGPRFTFGGTSFLSLVDRGPYRYIRHPQQAGRLLFLLGVSISFAACYQRVPLGVVVSWATALAVCMVEEIDLRRRSEYLSYCGKVRWMVCPGVL